MYEADWPDFIKEYGEEIILANYEKFEKLARDYNKAVKDLKEREITENVKYASYNKLFHTSTKFDLDAHLIALTEKVKTETNNVAKETGLEIPKKQLTTDEKSVQAKENFKEEQAQIAEEKKPEKLDIDKKQEQFLKAIDIEKAKAEQIRKDEERARILAELAANRRDITKDFER